MSKHNIHISKQAGFNIIELMVVLFVASILMSIGIPAFNGFMANNRMSTSANDMAITLHVARTESIKRRANVTICPSTEWSDNSPDCTDSDFSDGWIVFVDAVAPALPDLAHNGPQDIIYTHGPMHETITLSVADDLAPLGNDPFLVFGPNGFPLNALAGNDTVFNFQLCDMRGNQDTGGGVSAGRWIQITPTGRPQIYREVNQVQAAANPSNGC